MSLLLTILLIIADIPQELYSSYCDKHVIDSVYSECRRMAAEDYPADEDAGADYCLASAVARLKGNLSAAIKYAEECLIIDRRNGKDEYISSSLNNIAGLYMTHGDAITARKYIDEAIGLERKLGRRAYLAIRYGVASEIYLKLGETAHALEYADAALQLDSLDCRWDKDRLLAIAKAQIPKEITDEILSIASSTEAIPAIKLTRREMQIAELCAKGMISKEIADRLGISQRTVETHKNHIYKKLGINNTVELMQYIQKVFTDQT